MTDLADWLEARTGRRPENLALYEAALTHSSAAGDNYERLEFLGDRVLGLVVATWLIELYPKEPEGKLSHRLHALVAGDVCADVAVELGVRPMLRLGRQAQDDGVFDSVNVLGDVVEALIGALYMDAGFAAATDFVRRAWGDRVARLSQPPKHPKAMLQEWTAARHRRAPDYEVTQMSGPDHARRFTVTVRVTGLGEASGTGLSKQEAETAAARAMLDKLV
ncbi:MAG: ribonuclease III [Sphingomonas sp.]